MTYRYLDLYEATVVLQTGKSIQQWLGVGETLGFRILRWLEIDPITRGGWALFQHESLDSGNERFIDIGEFTDTQDPDQPEGLYSEHQSIEDVLQRCLELGALPDRFVQFPDAQYIYQEYYLKHGPPKRDPGEWFIPG